MDVAKFSLISIVCLHSFRCVNYLYFEVKLFYIQISQEQREIVFIFELHYTSGNLDISLGFGSSLYVGLNKIVVLDGMKWYQMTMTTTCKILFSFTF